MIFAGITNPPPAEPAPEPMPAAEASAPGKGRKRARTAAGTFQGDDPATPEKNEAWEEG
jgi:hypothetical protein